MSNEKLLLWLRCRIRPLCRAIYLEIPKNSQTSSHSCIYSVFHTNQTLGTYTYSKSTNLVIFPQVFRIILTRLLNKLVWKKYKQHTNILIITINKTLHVAPDCSSPANNKSETSRLNLHLQQWEQLIFPNFIERTRQPLRWFQQISNVRVAFLTSASWCSGYLVINLTCEYQMYLSVSL